MSFRNSVIVSGPASVLVTCLVILICSEHLHCHMLPEHSFLNHVCRYNGLDILSRFTYVLTVIQTSMYWGSFLHPCPSTILDYSSSCGSLWPMACLHVIQEIVIQHIWRTSISKRLPNLFMHHVKSERPLQTIDFTFVALSNLNTHRDSPLTLSQQEKQNFAGP